MNSCRPPIMMMNRIKCLAVMLCGLISGSAFAGNTGEPAAGEAFALPRIRQLMRCAKVERKNPDLLQTLLGLSERAKVDIGNSISEKTPEVYRIWSFVEGIDRVRILSISPDGSAEYFFQSTKGDTSRSIISADVIAPIRKSLEEKCSVPLDFRQQPATRGESEMTFIVERMNASGYAWAIRSLETSSDKGVQEMETLITEISKLPKP